MKYKVTMILEDHFVPKSYDVKSMIEYLFDKSMLTIKDITVEQEAQPDA